MHIPILSKTDWRPINVRGFKWPRRPTYIAAAYVIGEDAYGRWLGIENNSSWRLADDSRSGHFPDAFVKLVPNDTFWTVCFKSVDPIVDVDIALPATWTDDAIEEVDLELDIVRLLNGEVELRDAQAFDLLVSQDQLPTDIAQEAKRTSKVIFTKVEDRMEPFAGVGESWLAAFIAELAR